MFKKILVTLLISLAFAPQILYCQTFSSFLEKVNAADTAERNKMCWKYITNHRDIPIIESDTLVHFIYYRKATSVAVAGDATAWTPSLKMKHVEGSDLWYCTATYEPTARLEYKIVVDGKSWLLDAWNSNYAEGGMGRNSELVMPLYKGPEYTEHNGLKGRLIDTILQSKYLDEARQVRIYLPPSYKSGNQHYPVILFHDGFDFLKFTAAEVILDNMISLNRIRPVIAIFELPVQRDAEYSGKRQDKFTDYIVKELIPFLDAHYRTIQSPPNRVLAGISNGGNIALWIGATHPDVFGKVIAMSSNVEKNVTTAFKNERYPKLQVYLNLGKYDLPPLIPMVRNLKNILEVNHYTFKYAEYPEGHNWGFWQKYLPEALEFVFPEKTNNPTH